MDSHELLVFLQEKLTKLTAIKARSCILDDGLHQDWMTFSRANTASTETIPEDGNENHEVLLSDEAFSSNASPELKSN
jgi:hypothetical protein